MLEYYDKYKDAPSLKTASSIDKPMVIFLGLTLQDFISGVTVFLSIMMTWDDGIAVPIAIFLSCLCTFLSKSYRKYFPPRFLTHFNWSLGIQNTPGIAKVFSKRRFRCFGP